jgi:hypothetical protein
MCNTGKGYIVPSKNNYRLDKIGCYMHTRPKSTLAKLCFSIKKQQYLLYICYILLLQASDIELNPINKSSLEMPWNEFDVVTSADSKMLLEKFGMPQLLHIHDMFDFWSTLKSALIKKIRQ